MTPTLRKYPRTPHLEGSRLQPGDEDLDSAPFAQLAGRHLVVEEKVDGANAALSFAPDGSLRLQSRGHYLTGGPRERHFTLFKQWASAQAQTLWEVLGDRYVVYGEWLYAKHTVFYDQLPHYFLEYDVLDTAANVFLSTERRQALLRHTPLVGVPVLYAGTPTTLEQLTTLLGPSHYVGSAWRAALAAACAEHSVDAARVAAETDPSGMMEGLYIKMEAEGVVVARYKYVRATFLSAVLSSGGHWLDRPIVPNQLRLGADLYAWGDAARGLRSADGAPS